MLIVGINGSPMKEGNTVCLLKKGLEQARKMGAHTELIHASDVLKDVSVPFCVNCSNPCTGICAKGNALEKTLEIMREADGLIVGSPVYFGSITGQLKALFDKFRCLRAEKALLNTVGASVAVGATRFGGQEQTLRVINEMMLVYGMTIVGAGHPEHDCGHHGVAAQRPASEDKFAMDRMVILAKRVVDMARATETLRKH